MPAVKESLSVCIVVEHERHKGDSAYLGQEHLVSVLEAERLSEVLRD
jgi:hypothetical protein